MNFTTHTQGYKTLLYNSVIIYFSNAKIEMINRRKFMKMTGLSVPVFMIQSNALKTMRTIRPEKYFFKDDGRIPNSKYPLLLYHHAFSERGDKGGDWLEAKFAANKWTNSWRWGVYPFHHYHSNTHEVLGVFSGTALLHLGGETGEKLNVQAGDIIIIPAGVGHKCINHSENFTVVGAYPNDLRPDLMKGENGERPKADQNIAQVLLPVTDPLLGKEAGLIVIWK